MKNAAAALALLSIALGALGPPGSRFAALHAGLAIAAVALSCINAFRTRVALAAVAAGLATCLLRGELAHACLAPIFFASCVAVATWTPRAGANRRAMFLPALVFCQVALGAAYRHKVMGVMPHMAGALLVAGLLLIVCTMILQKTGQNAPNYKLRKAAGALLGIVLLQVSLGIAVFVMRLLDVDTGPAFRPLAAAHVTVGALTLAAATVLAMRA